MAPGPITLWKMWVVEERKPWHIFFSWGPKSQQMVTASMKLKNHLFLGRKVMTNLDNVLKSRDITLPTKVRIVKAMDFSSSHVRMWELEHKEDWELNNLCFQVVVLEKTLESPLDSKEIKPVNPKGNQFWVTIGKTDAEPETPVLWPPDAKIQLTEKYPDAGKDWRQKEKGVAEDEMIR